jgi:hypothetical protein
MSTTRFGDGIVFQCDDGRCDEEIDTGYTTWDYAKATMKEAGWYIFREPGSGPRGGSLWTHLCPTCGADRWKREKQAQPADPALKADLPWLKKKAS